MRDLKFRAFIDGEMVILPFAALQYFDFEGSYVLSFAVDGYAGFWAHEQYERATERKCKNAPIMQFAEFKDKNEKDIYEGDIVKFHYFYQSLGEGLGGQESEHELIGVVKWGAYGWAISAIKGEHWEGYTGYKPGEGESYIVDLYAMNESSIHEESFEVIGNIHEHPHLLNPAKGAVINSMNNIDPNEQKQEAAGQEATNEQVQATEQTAQENALESAEEGTTEG